MILWRSVLVWEFWVCQWTCVLYFDLCCTDTSDWSMSD